jgi:hypothetical protein
MHQIPLAISSVLLYNSDNVTKLVKHMTFKALKSFVKAANFIPLVSKSTKLTMEQADAAVVKGIAYFNANGNNFFVDNKNLRGFSRVAKSFAQAADKLGVGAELAAKMAALEAAAIYEAEYMIVAADASAYAALFSQGRTNTSWNAERQALAVAACKELGIN